VSIISSGKNFAGDLNSDPRLSRLVFLEMMVCQGRKERRCGSEGRKGVGRWRRGDQRGGGKGQEREEEGKQREERAGQGRKRDTNTLEGGDGGKEATEGTMTK
jgi:hypothetical protein